MTDIKEEYEEGGQIMIHEDCLTPRKELTFIRSKTSVEGEIYEDQTGSPPNNGTYFPEVRECPLCKGTGLIKVGKDPVGHADT